MLIITQLEQTTKTQFRRHLECYLKKLLSSILISNPNYKPEYDGHIIVIEQTDTDTYLSAELGSRWKDSLFEAVMHIPEAYCYHLVYLQNNQFTVSVIIPDEPWLDAGIRSRIQKVI